ncbi:MAG: NlpC/P60 family protein [Planctomycetota bacterium]|nr:NlpC/P60 family protein [Planctomycetota bacterium]
MLHIPDEFMAVRYVAARIPDGAGIELLGDGANCQRFAYAFLAHHGIVLPPFRSSDLWDDRGETSVATTFEPLDLLLFHARPEAYGAHVTVYVGDGRVLHLAAHRGSPTVETLAEVQGHERHRLLIGAKRALRRPADFSTPP